MGSDKITFFLNPVQTELTSASRSGHFTLRGNIFHTHWAGDYDVVAEGITHLYRESKPVRATSYFTDHAILTLSINNN
jgi:hypothetical protein